MQEIYLHPCEIWFGGGDTRVRTILGSCVSITLWHPGLQIGGICHFMVSRLPARGVREERHGCYADGAMALLEEELAATGQPPSAFEAKLFGAGMIACTTRGCAQCIPQRIQERNIAAGRAMARQYGHRVVAEHLGGEGHRQLVFDFATGLAWLKHTPSACSTCCAASANR